MTSREKLSPHLLKIVHLISEGVESEEELNKLNSLLDTLSGEEMSLVLEWSEIDTEHMTAH